MYEKCEFEVKMSSFQCSLRDQWDVLQTLSSGGALPRDDDRES